jgi:hypothetical protein
MQDCTDRDLYYKVTRSDRASGKSATRPGPADRVIFRKEEAFDYARRLAEVTKLPAYAHIRSAGYRVS